MTLCQGVGRVEGHSVREWGDSRVKLCQGVGGSSSDPLSRSWEGSSDTLSGSGEGSSNTLSGSGGGDSRVTLRRVKNAVCT